MKGPLLGKEFPCTCGGTFVVIEEPLAIGHYLPMCADFLAVSTDDEGAEYLRRCREAMEQKRN